MLQVDFYCSFYSLDKHHKQIHMLFLVSPIEKKGHCGDPFLLQFEAPIAHVDFFFKVA